MTALSEALVAAQRQAIAALSKDYVNSDEPDAVELFERLDAIGCTDKVEQRQLALALEALRAFGAQAPEPTKPDTSQAPATDKQIKFARDLAHERGLEMPDYALTKESAGRLIDQLQAGTYNPDEWTVPF
jgi:hypothetical protein